MKLKDKAAYFHWDKTSLRDEAMKLNATVREVTEQRDELLEALKYFLNVYEQEEWVSNEIGYAADIALAAIAKAEGTDQ